MRITSNAIQRETLAAIRNTMSGLADAQRRVATGKRVHAPSDDPVAADGILRSARGSRALEQYGRNIERAGSRLRAEESALEGLTNFLTRAKELGVAGLSGTADAQSLATLGDEAQVLLDAAVQAANTPFDDGFLFGGDAPDAPPFDATGVMGDNVRSAGHQVDIGGSGWFTTNHDGAEVFEDTGVFNALSELADALQSGDTSRLSGSLSELDAAFDGVQRVLSEVGARTNRLEVASANVEALDLNLKTLRSDLEDVEIEEAVADLVGRQMAYQSALLAASKIMSTTLADYIR